MTFGAGSYCGNGIRTSSEACDDGNTASADGCNASCGIESGYTCEGSPSICVRKQGNSYCGNGITEYPEDCDYGEANGIMCYPVAGGTCTSCSKECTHVTFGAGSYCGNGIQEYPEDCDYGAANGVVCDSVAGGTCTYCSQACALVTLGGDPYCGGGMNGSAPSMLCPP